MKIILKYFFFLSFFLSSGSVIAKGFNDTIIAQIFYDDLSGIKSEVRYEKGIDSIKVFFEKNLFVNIKVGGIYQNIFVPADNWLIIRPARYEAFAFSTSNKSLNYTFFFEACTDKYKSLLAQINHSIKSRQINDIILEEQSISELSKKLQLEYISYANKLADSLQINHEFRVAALGISGKLKTWPLLMYYKENKDFYMQTKIFETRLKSIANSFEIIQEELTLAYFGKEMVSNTLAMMFNGKVSPYLLKQADSATLRALFFIAAKNFNSYTKDYLLTTLLYHAMHNKVTIEPDLFKLFFDTCKAKNFIEVITNARKEYTTNKNINKKTIFMFDGSQIDNFEDMVKQQKTKLVVVDFWASWCKPCIEDMPNFCRVADTFKNNKNISFISVSTDANKEQWCKTVSKNIALLGLKANYRIADLKHFADSPEMSIRSIPRYMILDSQAEILVSQAPSPSNPQFQKLLNKLLQEQNKK